MGEIAVIVNEPMQTQERAVLVGVQLPGTERWEVEESLDELAQLVRSAGGEEAGRFIQKLDRPTAPLYIGKGKAQELGSFIQKETVQTAVFDEELSPAQTRNLEKILACKVIDRTQLILDVFARRARTREGKLQIELAQLQYLLPRLTRMWTHLSRQVGGIGTRGPGETQLEVDRRRVQEKISRFKRELAEVRKHRTVQREGRGRLAWPVCALVGYTNAGKSTLMNRLTSAEVLVEDKLFATLDPTIRKFQLPNGLSVLLGDTVGFLRKLPHDLVEAFQATLEEVVEADLLIHVVDVSHPMFESQMKAVEVVLKQIHAEEKPVFTVFNKIDQMENHGLLQRLRQQTPHSAGISAETGEGMEAFYSELEEMLARWRLRVRLRIPQTEGALISEVHRLGRVLETRYEGEDVLLLAHLPPELEGRLKKFKI